MINFGSVIQGATIQRGAKMEETELSNPLFVVKKLLAKNFILSLSLLTLHKILKPL